MLPEHRSHSIVVSHRFPSLPLELIVLIIGLLRRNYKALLYLALSSRALYPFAKDVMYSDVKIEIGSAFQLRRLLRFKGAHGAEHAVFAELTEIHIEPRDCSSQSKEPLLHQSILAFVGTPLPKLRCLRLRYGTIGAHGVHPNLHSGTFGRHFNPFASVRELDIIGTTFSNFKDFLRIVSLPQLESLSARRLWFLSLHTIPIDMPPTVISICSLKQISLAFYSPGATGSLHHMLHWLANTRSIRSPTLQSFTCKLWESPERTQLVRTQRSKYQQAVNNILRGAGASLRALDVEMEVTSKLLPGI